MRDILEKTGVFILVALTVFSSLILTSCNRSFDETEVLEEGEKLLKRAEMLNIVYFGSGIEYHETDEGVGYYYKANTQHLEKLGFNTIEELKKITE